MENDLKFSEVFLETFKEESWLKVGHDWPCVTSDCQWLMVTHKESSMILFKTKNVQNLESKLDLLMS